MIQNVIRAMGGVAVFGIISVCLFFSVFLLAAIFACTRRKAFCDQVSSLPLQDGSMETKGISHE